MGGEQANGSLLLSLVARQGQGLETPTVKNTFLHYEGLQNDEAEPVPLGRRIRTDPTPEVAGFGLSSLLSEVPESLPSGEPDLNSDEDESVEAETQQQGPTTFKAPEWQVPARKFRSKDTRLSKTFLLPDAQQQISHGDDASIDTEYVVTLYPTQASKRRGGASFSASHGRGFIHVKCTAPSDELERRISVQIGESEPSTLLHNFAHDPVCRLPGEYNFEEHLNETSGNLSVLFEIATLPPTLAAAPVPCMSDTMLEAQTAASQSSCEASVASAADETLPSMSMWPSWQSNPSSQNADGQVYQQACWYATPWAGWVSAASYGAPTAWVDPQNAADIWLDELDK